MLGWAGSSTHTVPLPAPGPYRVRYCATGMDEGRRRDTTLEGEDAPDRYRLQFWPAPIGPDAILRCSSEIAAYWHGNVTSIPPPIDPGVPLPAQAVNLMTVVANATVDTEPVAAGPGVPRAADLAWFARHVSATPLSLTIEFDPHSDIVLLDHDEASGAFRASLGHLGVLARRPRSVEPWDLVRPIVQHRWSTTRWDWAMDFYGTSPTARSIDMLIRQLGDGI